MHAHTAVTVVTSTTITVSHRVRLPVPVVVCVAPAAPVLQRLEDGVVFSLSWVNSLFLFFTFLVQRRFYERLHGCIQFIGALHVHLHCCR